MDIETSLDHANRVQFYIVKLELKDTGLDVFFS